MLEVERDIKFLKPIFDIEDYSFSFTEAIKHDFLWLILIMRIVIVAIMNYHYSERGQQEDQSEPDLDLRERRIVVLKLWTGNTRTMFGIVMSKRTRSYLGRSAYWRRMWVLVSCIDDGSSRVHGSGRWLRSSYNRGIRDERRPAPRRIVSRTSSVWFWKTITITLISHIIVYTHFKL